jgi:HK97 family phage major capsid protein
MANVYNQGVFRVGPGYDVSGVGDALVPEPLATSIIQELPKKSAALSLMKKTVLSTKTERMPVLDVLPVAYWVGGDTGMKQTSQQQWKNVVMVVEELACIIPIPQAYLDDADVPIWDEVQPRMVEAAGQLIDEAVFWDIGKPSTWGTSVVGGAVAAGNIVQDGYTTWGGGTSTAATDFGQSVTSLGDNMSQTGYTINGFAGRPGLNWRLAGLRSSQGVPIYSSINQDMSSSSALQGQLYGFPISLVDNGSWQGTDAQLIAGDFSKAIIGVRQDISFKLFTEGVISNDSGAVVLNLMQQDAVAMRMVMRIAYATVNPVTIMQPGKGITQRWPFAVVATPAGRLLTGGNRADTAGVTSGSSVVTDTSILATDLGRKVTGTGIPAGTVVTSVVPGTSFTMSQVATASSATDAITIGALVGLEAAAAGTVPSLDTLSAEERQELRAQLDALEEGNDGGKTTGRSRSTK